MLVLRCGFHEALNVLCDVIRILFMLQNHWGNIELPYTVSPGRVAFVIRDEVKELYIQF